MKKALLTVVKLLWDNGAVPTEKDKFDISQLNQNEFLEPAGLAGMGCMMKRDG